VECLPEFRFIAQLDRLDTLVLPEVECLSDAHAAQISRWVEGGGTLLATFKCGLLDEQHRPRINFPLAEALGVDFRSEERRYAFDEKGNPRPTAVTTYLEPAGHPLAELFEKKTVGLPGSFLHIQPTTAQTVMRYRLPLMVEDLPRHQFYNFGPPPPGADLAGPAVTFNRFGKGQAVYVGAPLFRAMKDRPYWIRQWIPFLLRQLVPDPIAELRLEPFSEYTHGTFFHDQSGRFLLVQVLNATEIATGGELWESPAVRLVLNPAQLEVTGARMIWPQTVDLTPASRDGKTHISLPRLERYSAVLLRLA